MLNILRNFSDVHSKHGADSPANDEDVRSKTQELMNSHLYQDIATEEFYVLVKRPNGSEQRMYLSNEQLREMMS